MSSKCKKDHLVVGSVVRAKRGSKRCRAMVATVTSVAAGDTDTDKNADADADPTGGTSLVCLLWEPIHPVPISGRFWIAPNSVRAEEDQGESTIDIGLVEELLPFETVEKDASSNGDGNNGNNGDHATAAAWKEKGDQLLRLGDASAATPYYEKALSESSSVSIGGSIVVSIDGFPRIAEVDCIDDDNGDNGNNGEEGTTIDVTLTHNGEERTIQQSSVLLSVAHDDDDDDEDRLQERILLNLARCMLQLADGTDHATTNANANANGNANRPKYLKSAVLATTLVLALASHRQHEQQSHSAFDETTTTPAFLPATSETALVLRCKAYESLSRWKNAMSDARQLIRKSKKPEQGQKLLAGIERKKKLRARTDKKLARDICRLVQSATATATATAASEESSLAANPVSPSESANANTNANTSSRDASPPSQRSEDASVAGRRMIDNDANDDASVSFFARFSLVQWELAYYYCILPVAVAIVISHYWRHGDNA